MIATIKGIESQRRTGLASGSQRLVLDDITWDEYRTIGSILRDRPALRLTYDQGSLEIMTTSPEHEKYKVRLGRLIETLAEEFGLRLEPGGNMTFQRDDLDRGLEADQCYWIQNEERVRGKLAWDPANDPPPDLVIEIEVSRSALSRLAIYATLGVPEVWCFDGESLSVLGLQADGSYLPAAASPAFPLVDLHALETFLHPSPEQDYLSVIRAFRDWLRQQQKGPQ